MRFDFWGNAGRPPSAPWSLEDLTLPPGLGNWLRWLAVAILALLLFIGLAVARGIYVDWIWFRSLGYSSIFVTILVTRLWLFAVGAAVFAALAAPNVYLAFRFSRGGVLPSIPLGIAQWLRKVAAWASALVVLILSAIFGAVASGQWETFLRFFNSQPFGTTDPLYFRDAGFYIFSLPVMTFIQGWLLGAVVVLLVAVAGLYFGLFALRGLTLALTYPVKAHLSALVAVLFLVIAWTYWVDLYEVLLSSGGAAFGASYADVNARIPALRVLMAITTAGALLMIGNIFVPGLRLAVAAVGLWVGGAILVGAIYPAAIQRFRVEPNELSLERQFINRNIDFTRQAYGLDTISVLPYDVEDLNQETVDAHPDVIDNVRVWDYRPLQSLYNQRQFIRPYYDFLDVDVDRYQVDDRYRQVMLGARELSPEKLPEEAQGWVNQRLQWTHGYGAAMSPVNEFTPEGHPRYFLEDVPPRGKFDVERPEIYYGESSRSFVIVNTNVQEIDFPTDAGPVYTSYQGKGGVPLDSFIDRLVFAWHFRDFNVLISGQITSESRIQFRRTIQDRVSTLAPFLRLDQDPYLVVADGQLWWIQDTYTVTDRYPYSTPTEDGGFNYIRNSVKVVVNAYDGTTDFYVVDDTDPIMRTYREAFPDLFQTLDAMPATLRDHLRYPVDLFSIQANTYLTYHMTDVGVFYNREDQWSIPQEVVSGSRQPVEPYYIISRLLESQQDEFLLILPFTPVNRPNMVSWLAARNDPPSYGELVLYNFPRGRQIDGPAQIEARIDNDAQISEQFTLWGQVGSTVIRGNLLVIPIGRSILYVEPIYLQAENLPFPELRRVIVADSTSVTMQQTLDDSLLALFGTGPPVVQPPPGEDGEGGIPPSGLQQEVQGLRDALSALREGLAQLEDALSRLEQLAQEE